MLRIWLVHTILHTAVPCWPEQPLLERHQMRKLRSSSSGLAQAACVALPSPKVRFSASLRWLC